MEEREEIKEQMKGLAWLVALVVACAVTKGYALLPVAIAGLWCAFSGRRGLALLAFAYLPLLTCLNPIMVPTAGVVPTIARLTFILMCIIMAVTSSTYTGNGQIPLGGLVVYLLVAIISSINGWFPAISYMKIINFFCFLVGVWFGTRNLDRSPEDLDLLHRGFFVMAIFLSFGSIAVWPFPAIAYQQSMSIAAALAEGGSQYVAALVKEAIENDQMFVFAGVTYNSQCLGPLLACCFAWVLCDMLFVARRFTKLHIATLCAIVLPLYLTRSRTALFALGVSLIVVSLMTMHRMNLHGRIKAKVQSILATILLLGIVGAAIVEINDRTISKWLRKTNDLSSDRRTFEEALTGSREVLNEINWDDFHKNPILGMGFQVMELHRERYLGQKFVLSAPIEKGLLPLMILGETGVVGFIVFCGFLICFFSGCKRRNLHVTATMFIVLCATNIGEATFFSPGGSGGTLWMMSVVGGYVIDMKVRRQNMFNGQMMDLVGYP